MLVDLNSGSGFVYGAPSAVCDAGVRINALIDAALEAEHRSKPPRDYLGGSRIGEPCARRLAYEVTLTPVDDGKDFDGRLLRIFDAGHQFEDLTIRWLQAAGFDLRTRGRDGRQFGFSIAGGRLRGHIDGVDRRRPRRRHRWPALFEHKALNQKLLDRPGQARAQAVQADLLRAVPAVHGLHGARGRPAHGDEQGHPGALPRGRAASIRPRRRGSPTRRSTSCARSRPRSCRPGSRQRPTSISAGCAPTPGAAGRATHERELHALRPAGRRRSARSRTGSCTGPQSSRCSGCSAMPASGRPPSPGTPSTSSASTP